jgi:putative MATE family efflux protein
MARRVGEHDTEGASKTAVQVIALGVAVSALMAVSGVSLAPRLLTLMGGSPGLVRYGTPYMRVMFGGNASILLLFLANAVVRGAGDGTIAMRALWLANGLNLIFVPLFVYGWGPVPALGVTGASCATTISRGIGTAYTLSHLFRGAGRVKVHRRDFVFLPDLMGRLLKLSGSGMFQIFIGTASWVGLVRVVSSFGSDAVAGYTVGIRVVLFALFPAFGLSNAAATMVGQSLGAKKPERAEKAVWLAGLYNLAFLGTMGVIFVAFAPAIVRLFSDNLVVEGLAASGLRMVACGFPLYAFGIVVTQSFNGAGDTWTPTFLNFFLFWAFEIPAAYVFSSSLAMGPRGAFLAITLAFSGLAVASAVVFRRGRWKKVQV